MKKTILLSTALLLLSAKSAFAQGLSVRIETPKSPTVFQNFKITFVALDAEDRNVTARCLKQGPGDSGFSQFGSDFNFIPGGNSASCAVDSNIVNQKGTYNFKVSATAGSDTVESQIVSVSYNSDTPGDPYDYQKEQIGNCTYRIKFHSNDDAGKTVRIDVFRTTENSLDADSSHRIASYNIGSNQSGSVENTVSDCSKTNYFGIRAYSASGAGSNIIGDTFTTTTITSTVLANPSSKPQSQGGAVLGRNISVREGTKKDSNEATGSAENGSNGSGQNPTPSVLGNNTDKKGLNWPFVIGASAIIIYVFLRQRSKKS